MSGEDAQVLTYLQCKAINFSFTVFWLNLKSILVPSSSEIDILSQPMVALLDTEGAPTGIKNWCPRFRCYFKIKPSVSFANVVAQCVEAWVWVEGHTYDCYLGDCAPFKVVRNHFLVLAKHISFLILTNICTEERDVNEKMFCRGSALHNISGLPM